MCCYLNACNKWSALRDQFFDSSWWSLYYKILRQGNMMPFFEAGRQQEIAGRWPHSEAPRQAGVTGWQQPHKIQWRQMQSLTPGKEMPLCSYSLGQTGWGAAMWRRPRDPGGQGLSVRLWQQTANSASDYVSRSMAKRLREVIAP